MKHTLKLIFLYILIINFLLYSQPPIFASETERPKTINFSISIDEPTVVDRILYAALKRLGYDCTFEAMGMTSAIQTANSSEKDGLFAQVAGIEKTYPNLVMVTESVTDVKFEAYALEEKALRLSTWSDFAGLRVGTVFQKPYITSHLPNNVASLTQEPSVPVLIQSLVEGKCDVIVMSNSLSTDLITPHTIVKAGLIETAKSYSYLNKKYEYLVPELSKTIADMKADGTYARIVRQEQLEKNGRFILHISSYYADMEWEKQLKEGIEQAFSQTDDIDIYTVSLNSNRISDDDSQAKAVYSALRASILKQLPEVVIVSDENALNFINNYYSRIFYGIPIVFCGIENYDENNQWRVENRITGVQENISAYETVETILKLFPKTTNLFVINDHYRTGVIWKKQIAEQLKPFAESLNIIYNDDNKLFSGLIEDIEKLPPNTVILSGFYFVDADGNAFSSDFVQSRIASASKYPVFGLMDTSLGYGQIGGKYNSGLEQGRIAGELALSVANGASIESLPIQSNYDNSNIWTFDHKELQKWDISELSLPAGSTIVNKAPALHEANPAAFYLLLSLMIIAMLIVVGLTIFMYILKTQNKKLVETQKSLFTAEELLERDTMIKEVKERLEKTLESAPLVYMLILDNKVIETNQYLKDILDVPIGSDVAKLVEGQEVVDFLDEMLLSSGAVFGAIQKVKTKTGDFHRFHINLASVDYEGRQAAVVWGIDIEESERRKDYLARNQEELQKLINTIPIPLFVANPDNLKILYANQFFLELFGLKTWDDQQELFVSDYYAEKQPDDANSEVLFSNYVHQIVTSNSVIAMKWIFTSPQGKSVYSQIMGSVVEYANINCVVVAIQDLAAEKMREDLLIRAAQKEREANQMKSLFLMNMSHEIRTPMNAIIGFSQLALHRKQDPYNAESYKKINTSARNLLSIINDILDFSKIEAEKLDLIEEPFELEEVISNAFMVAAERIEQKKVEMLLDICSEIPFTIIGDKTRIWQVLKNILDNSAKFTEIGRIILKIDILSDDPINNTIELIFTVQDSGLGMTEEQLNQLFIPFEQFHTNTRNSISGTGLGMPITKQLVDLMKGSITVESEIGIGTKTTVILPLKYNKNTKTMREIFDMGEVDLDNVLIADDDEYALQIMDKLLQSIGISPVCVSSGDEVLATAQAYNDAGRPFRVFVLDYLLGEDNGIEVAKKLRQIATGNSKLLMVSAYSKQLLTQEIHEAGFSDVIEKPFVPSTFISKLCNSMQRKVTIENEYFKFGGIKVLLCEDNLINQEVAKEMLEVFGIEPTIANNGQEALILLEQEEFHLIFMDIMMPIMDGHEATKIIRSSNKSYKNIPIIAMTANVMEEEVNRCLREGMNAHIGKPMDINQIYSALLLYLPEEVLNTLNEKINMPSPVDHDVFPEIEGIDIKSGISRFGGNRYNYYNALLQFAKTLENTITYENATVPENRAQLSRKVHSIKGVSGNLGVDFIYQASLEFERLLNDSKDDKENYNTFFNNCHVMRELILEHLDDQFFENHKPSSLKELREILFDLTHAYNSSRIDRCEILIKDLLTRNWSNEKSNAVLIKQIITLVNEYAFEDALRLFDDQLGENNDQ